MAFALTKFKAYGIRHSGAVRPHAKQVCEFHITAANTDTALDLDNPSGTFWTAALANATYGSLATQALNVFLTQMPAVTHRYLGVLGDPLGAYVQVLTLTAGAQYTTTLGGTTAHYPAYAFNSGSAPTALNVFIEFSLIDDTEPVVSDLGAQVTN